MIDSTRFETLARRAEAMRRAGGSDAEWWAGYARGLRRAFHGESFGTEDEHALWLALVERPDPTGAARGAGYRAGLLALESDVEPPAPGPDTGRPDVRLHNPDPTYLRALIERAGLSQRAAARALGVGERAMRAYLADRDTASAETAPYLVQYGLERLAALADPPAD